MKRREFVGAAAASGLALFTRSGYAARQAKLADARIELVGQLQITQPHFWRIIAPAVSHQICVGRLNRV